MFWKYWPLRLAFFLFGFTFAAWASRIPEIKAALGLSDAELGTVLLATPIGQLLGLQFSGKLAARFGSHRVAPLALALYAGVLNLCGLARSPWQLAAALGLFGLSGNIASVSLQTQGVLAEKQAARSLMSSFHAGWSIAGFCAGLTGLVLVAEGVPVWQHFLATTVVFVSCLPLIAPRLLRSPAAGARTAPGGRARFNPLLVQLGLIGFCSLGTEGCMFDWTGVYFREVVAAPDSLVVLGYTAFMVTAAAGRIVGDRVIGRYGRLRVLQGGGLLMSGGLLLSVVQPTLVAATLAFMLVGLGASTIIPTVYSLAGQSRPEEPGTALAAVASISFFGFLIAPPLIGGISSQFGLRASFAVIACLGLVIPWAARSLPLPPATGNLEPTRA